jgi:hypothetical protein
MPVAGAHGLEMYCESHGTGPPLLLIGGLGLDVSEMGAVTRPLAERSRVVAFAAEMHRSIPGSQLILVDGGHLFSLHAHNTQFVAGVTAFLSADGSPLAYDHLC